MKKIGIEEANELSTYLSKREVDAFIEGYNLCVDHCDAELADFEQPFDEPDNEIVERIQALESLRKRETNIRNSMREQIGVSNAELYKQQEMINSIIAEYDKMKIDILNLQLRNQANDKNEPKHKIDPSLVIVKEPVYFNETDVKCRCLICGYEGKNNGHDINKCNEFSRACFGHRFSIGDIAFNGVVVYVDETGQHGLIASKKDLGVCDWYVALSSCNDYGRLQHSDNLWHLPAKEELNLLYLAHKQGIGNLVDNLYWSSSEYSSDYAWYQNFSNGNQCYINRHNPDIHICPVRRF